MNSDQHILQQLQQQQASMNSDQQMLQQQPPMISDQQLVQQMQMQLLFQQQSQQQQQKYLQQKKIQQLRLQHSTAKSSLPNQIVAAHSMNREDVQRQKEILSEAERCMQTSVQTAAQLFPKATDASASRSGIGGDKPTELKIRNLPARNLKSSYGMKDGKRVLLGVEVRYSSSSHFSTGDLLLPAFPATSSRSPVNLLLDIPPVNFPMQYLRRRRQFPPIL